MDVDQKPNLRFTPMQAGGAPSGNVNDMNRTSYNTMEVKKDIDPRMQSDGGAFNSESSVETLALTQTHMTVHSEQQHLIEDLELRKRANELIIPTNDEHVKARLEELGEPIILFGETKPLRRQRLRLELAKRGLTEGMPKEVRELGFVAVDLDAEGPKRPFTTEGLPALKAARLAILRDSIPRSQKRLRRLQAIQNYYAKMTDTNWHTKLKRDEETFYTPLASCLPTISVVGDTRPLTTLAFNDTGSRLATGSWSPVVKVWNPTTGELETELKGHTERLVGVAFAPSSNNRNLQLASCGFDRTVRLWNLESGKCMSILKGHDDRVNVVNWHPTGTYLFSSSHDRSWSMWDAETGTQMVRQDGHSRGVFGMDLHPDGGLLATGSIDASVRIWDLRAGDPIHTFMGHVRQVIALNWHPDGHSLASASDDHSVRIWDIRMKKFIHALPAHQGLVSGVKFAPFHGKYLVTSGFDSAAKVWRTDDYTQVCTLSGHDSRVVGVDISPMAPPDILEKWTSTTVNSDIEEQLPPVCIATASADRTWKLWGL